MKFEAILFDCDGVLVDSEPLTLGVLRDMLAERGWDLPPDECERLFLGRQVRSQRALIEARTGQPLTDAWMDAFYARRNEALRTRLRAMPGALRAAQAAHRLCGGRIACASGADRAKVELQLAKVDLLALFDGRIFSGHEMPATKPAPDVYLAAARHLQRAPERCLVIEDTTVGVTAGKAAGATVWALCPEGAEQTEALRDHGADRLFASMAELPALLARAGCGAP
ncbi:MAG: HAD family phosphatase [Ottowia sp.]|uniref:HAD family hydrolase n=1 Tax=Ottowia sp. TaxID=1898956 RepID=UPI0039E5CABB